MDSQTFMEFEVRPQMSLEDALYLADRLDIAREKGYASEMDDVLTRVTSWDTDYENGKITIKTKPALFPKPSLSESEMFRGEHWLFGGPYLSIIGQVYTGQESKKPEKHLVHVRTRKTFQGHEKVSASYAGYCEYVLDDKLITPIEAAVHEFKEEIKNYADIKPLFVQDGGSGLILTERPTRTLDIPMHFMGKQRLRNPLLSFVNYVDSKYESIYPTVESLGDLDKVCQETEGDFEVAGIAWVPHNKLPEFWEQVRKADRVFSISNEISDNLRAYFDVLSK